MKHKRSPSSHIARRLATPPPAAGRACWNGHVSPGLQEVQPSAGSVQTLSPPLTPLKDKSSIGFSQSTAAFHTGCSTDKTRAPGFLGCLSPTCCPDN
ncbi:unnamed protein product [Arctogadus glacialis]